MQEEKRKELLESTLPSTLSTLDKLLKENNNGERFFVGNDVSIFLSCDSNEDG